MHTVLREECVARSDLKTSVVRGDFSYPLSFRIRADFFVSECPS